jgi:hypothetical protein
MRWSCNLSSTGIGAFKPSKFISCHICNKAELSRLEFRHTGRLTPTYEAALMHLDPIIRYINRSRRRCVS